MQVYKAVLGGSSVVAVKVLHETDEAADFGQEIAILRSCRHSNIVQFQVGLGRLALSQHGVQSMCMPPLAADVFAFCLHS